MPAFGPISRVELIQCFRRLGFAGPFSGGKHQFTIRVPSPHHGDISKGLLSQILRQAGVRKGEWESI